jgi:hypothetical protein
MSREVDFEVESAIGVEQIHAAYSEADYWVSRLAAYGDNGRLDAIDVVDGSVHVVTVQDLRTALLPKPFGKLYPRDLAIVQDQTWTLVDGELHGQVRIEARGAPGSGRSSVVLAPAGSASQLRCTATVKVDVRFVGGTIEGMLSRQMVDDTPEMLRFTTQWLDAQA